MNNQLKVCIAGKNEIAVFGLHFLVKKLGKELNCFMRIDMYATNKGPVFGELTPTPEGGIGYTDFDDDDDDENDFCDEYQCSHNNNE